MTDDDASGVGGQIRLSNTALAKLAGRAAIEVADVGAAGGGRWGLRRASLPRTAVAVDGPRASIQMAISVRWPAPLGRVTASLRQHLRERMFELTELTVADIHLTVADLVSPTGVRVR